MSFRTRLSSFFIVIVLLPMVAMAVLGYRLISDSEQGKADARAVGLASAAAAVYAGAEATARADALTLARDPALASARPPLLARIATQAGLARVILTRGSRTLVDVGDPTAIAPGIAQVRFAGGAAEPMTLTVSALTAAGYVRELTEPQNRVIVRAGVHTLASSIDATGRLTLAPRGTVTVGGTGYREITEREPGIGGPVAVTVLSSLAATASQSGSSRLLGAAFIAAFLLLAIAFALLSSRALQAQITRFLHAARRLGAGDFSAAVPAEGRDEFAALAEEFNWMSAQLERRLEELSQERARLRESVRRIGQTFASNLDQAALLDLALTTAIDATQSVCGRVEIWPEAGGALVPAATHGPVGDCEAVFSEAERLALAEEALGRGESGDLEVVAAALRPMQHGSRTHGVIAVGRSGRPFSEDEIDLLRSLAGQAALALENIALHRQVSRQAVTDELTGLANHGRFQELLAAEAEQVRRYRHPLGLILLDLDNFKAINDTYGHPQGDVVLRRVGAVMRENSRDADTPARYGGEEIALILPHTDLTGAHAIAERIRVAIERLEIPRVDGGSPLRITASVGVAASREGEKDALIAAADTALYEAKRCGKNRTVRASAPTANVVGAE